MPSGMDTLGSTALCGFLNIGMNSNRQMFEYRHELAILAIFVFPFSPAKETFVSLLGPVLAE